MLQRANACCSLQLKAGLYTVQQEFAYRPSLSPIRSSQLGGNKLYFTDCTEVLIFQIFSSFDSIIIHHKVESSQDSVGLGKIDAILTNRQ